MAFWLEEDLVFYPKFKVQVGISFLQLSGFDGAIYYRYMGDRPANENNSVTARGVIFRKYSIGLPMKGFRVFG